MAVRWLTSSGNFSSTSVWNDGTLLGIPTTGDDVFTNGFTVNMDVNATVNSLNNSARARDIATPQMTSNTTPSPVSIATSSTQSGNLGWFAFDRNYATATNFWQAGAATGWISVDFGSGNATVIDAYTIFASSAQASNMRNWTFEGSNDNINWTVIQTVTLPSAIAASSTYASGSIGNVTAYRYYRVNITLNGGGGVISTTEIELYRPGTAALASGGSFNFNTAGVTVSATSTSASLSAGATNLITVTATTGTVTLNLGSSVTGLAIVSSQIFNHTGNCNFNLSGLNFTGGASASAFVINKSSTGTVTVTGNLFAGGGGIALNSTNGNTVVIGNVTAGSTVCINQTAGNLTCTGNVVGGGSGSAAGISLTGAASQFTINGNVTGGPSTAAHGINFTGTSGIVNGNVIGSSGVGNGINTTGAVTVNGNVFGAATFGINTTSAITLTINGDVYASATANGISSTNASGVVNLTGNMYNGLGRNAIYCQNVFISNTATTLWRMDTGGGNYKFLYSADSTPNLPATTNVRNGVTFGPALSLTGTMVVPAASNVRTGVAVDNTVGTGDLTSADIISGINASSDPLAVRLKNALTDVTAGNIISQYKDS